MYKYVYVPNTYKKVYCKLLIAMCMMILIDFAHTSKCDRSTQVGVEPVINIDINLTFL